MTTTDRESAALLAAIVASPDDDTPRLAYADRLDELGDETAAEELPCPVCKNSGEPGWVHTNGKYGPGYYPCRGCADIENGERRGSGTVRDTSRRDELHARAELIRVQVEMEGIPDPPPEPQRGDPPDDTLTMLENLQAWRRKWSPRFYELRSRSTSLLTQYPQWSRWTCPGCKGKGGRTAKVDGGYGTERVNCSACGGSGDLFRREFWGHDAHPVTFRRGFPDTVEVERIAELVERRCPGCGRRSVLGSDGWLTCHCDVARASEDHPAPWLRAVATRTTVRRVVPRDQVPYHNGAGYCWFDTGIQRDVPTFPEIVGLPSPVFRLLKSTATFKGRVRWRDYLTFAAAVDALGEALVRWGRGETS